MTKHHFSGTFSFMLRGFYAPSDFLSRDLDPSLTADEKLAIINTSPVLVRPTVIKGRVFEDDFIISLPFVDGGSFNDGLKGFPETLFTDYINVSDAALYGRGIGSRLLKAAFRHSIGHNNNISEFHTGWARLGLVNATISVLSEENVGVECGGNRYGWGSDKPLDSVLDDFPPVPGAKCLVNSIVARIDRELAMSWEAPVCVELKPI